VSGVVSFRSVNLREDLHDPRRLAHYRPTRRSVSVVRSLLESGSRMVIAAYGSGKSLAAGVGALLVINDASTALKPVIERLGVVDPDLAILAGRRSKSRVKGRVIVLSGHVRDLPGALCEAIGACKVKSIDGALNAMEVLANTDHVAVIWDEFGRHLEGIVNEGRSRDLDAVQRLAEWTDRARQPSASLTLLLHQNLLAYATVLNQTSRNEWRKIEGRFQQVRFVEDSQELYELAATVIAERRPQGLVPPGEAALRRVATGAMEAGWFDGMADEERVVALLARAYPVSAAALHVLPHLVARIGQNERSLFSFIGSADLSRAVGMEEVYQAFSDTMRADVGIGGSHRRWVEAETARSRASDDVEREALAAACLLQMGVDGERRKLTQGALQTAVASKNGASLRKATPAIEALISRKLLVHRKLNDDVSIWHGADVDLNARVREERARRFEGFDLLRFLDAQHPAPFVRPTGHNLRFGTARYLIGRYMKASEVAAGAALPPAKAEAPWGSVVYILADSAEELAKARRRVETGWPGSDRTLVVLPSEPIAVHEAALEIDALVSLQGDDTLLAEDPLIRQELTELLAVARRQLAVVLHRLTSDRPIGAEWWHVGQRLPVDRDHPAGIAASTLLNGLYGSTPRIVNDQVMRNRLSRQMETARIRVLTHVLEKGHDANLGYREEELTSAEGSVYRTVLATTGLHRSEGVIGRFAQPSEIGDPGLRAVWGLIADFFTQPGSKTLDNLVTRLSSPPYGVPAGVLPLLVVSGYKAFGRAVSLYVDADYPADLLGFDAARLFLEPQRVKFNVYPSDDKTLGYLSEVAYIFAHCNPGPMDEAVRFAVDAIKAWRRTISDGVRRSRRHTDDGRKLLNLLAEHVNPDFLLMSELPNVFGARQSNLGRFGSTLRTLEKARNDVDRLVEGYVREAVEVVGEVLSLERGAEPLVGVQSWVRCLNVPALMRREDLTMVDKAVLRTASDTTNGRFSAESLARAVSSVLLQRGVEKWEDGTAPQLRRLLRDCRTRIEDAALADPQPGDPIAGIVEVRIEQLNDLLRRLRWEDEAKRVAVGGMR
jgi:hypothetical protein